MLPCLPPLSWLLGWCSRLRWLMRWLMRWLCCCRSL
jgi:hypothetical protein